LNINEGYLVKELLTNLSSNKVLLDKEIIKLYTMESSGLSGDAIAVVFPEDSDDVSKVISIAYKYGFPVYGQGSSSSLSGNAVPLKKGIVVSFERMNRLKEVSILDSIAIVEPGIRIEELNNILEEKGYMFPIDPSSQSVATIGGAINNGAGGLRGAKYGTMKDWVNGLEIVLPDENGTKLRIGCLTLKCRQGYDLVRLIIGSEGTLALVTEAILRITPIPEKVVTALALFNDINDLLNSFIQIKSSGVQPFIAEFMDDKTVEIASKGVDLDFVPKGHMFLVSIDTTNESTNRFGNWLLDLFKKNNATDIHIALTQEEADEKGLFKIRRNLFASQVQMGRDILGKNKSKVFIEDIVVPPSKIPLAVSKFREISNKYGLLMSLGGHIGDGNLHPSVNYDPNDEEMKKKVYNWFKEIMKASLDLNGSISAEHGIGVLKKEGLKMELMHKSSDKNIELMKSIKSIFDPKAILNPNKIFDITNNNDDAINI
jgi:glycolate oxidase